MLSLAELQQLYDQNRFIEAFRQSGDYWNPSVQPNDLSADELVLGGRLAWRLGAPRIARWIFRAALDRFPTDPRVNYFARGVRRHPVHLFDELRNWETDVARSDTDLDTQVNWLGTQAVTWASLRDFSCAHGCIESGHRLHINTNWILTCESNVFGLEDRWTDALNSAEQAWQISPGTPFAAHCLGQSLLNLGRVREAAERLAITADAGESFEVAQLACWFLCALAETVEGDERSRLLRRARIVGEKLPILAPLADRETRAVFARVWLDIAEMEDDHVAMERWSKEVQSPFHRTVLENLRKNPNGLRIRLPFRRAIQKHEACLPTSVSSSLAAMGIDIDPDAMASDITFGGTAEWAAAEWLGKLALEVRFFVVIPEVAARLIKNGIAFVMTLETDGNAHALAVVGLDEAAGTLIIHDPQSFRTTEYLLSSIGDGESPLAPKGMAAVPREKATLLDSLLPETDVQAATASETHQQATLLHGPVAARKVIADLAERQPHHPITKLLRATQDIDDGRFGLALVAFRELSISYPDSARVRAKLLACSRSLDDTALMRATLAGVVERGVLPGVQSQQAWFYPPSMYVSEYADLLRNSAETSDYAASLLHAVIHRESSSAQAWHVLADLLWDKRDIDGALLAYRIASGLAHEHEHYARAYCDALAYASRKEEGLQWLEARARNYGDSSRATATWITWINALEDWGHPERALEASKESLNKHGHSPELLAFVVPFLARMGRWQEAGTLLDRLGIAGNATLFHQASADFHERRGALDQALEHARAWMDDSPISMSARREVLRLIARRDGARAALNRATQWLSEHRGHEEYEQLCCQYLDQTNSPAWKKYSILLRRVKRNPEDGWAWRELAFACISQYESKEEAKRVRLRARIEEIVAQCDRVAPEDAATLRVHGQWCEAQADWPEAIRYWLESIHLEPNSSYSHRQLWDCVARSTAEQRNQCWRLIAEKLITSPGRLSVARETIMLAAQRFGLAVAEQTVSAWKERRPDDPEVIESFVDLLLEYGNGRTDDQRALEILQPGVQRFPFHFGLRFSLADSLRRIGKLEEAESALDEIIRRHPGSTPTRIRIAHVQERRGEVEEALQSLTLAANLDPQNHDISGARVQILIAANRREEARAEIQKAISQFPESVPWRERAIKLLANCGDDESAVQAARDGVLVYPHGAYLWFLLARTLNEERRFAAQGEIESCFRRSLALNQGLFTTADSLAMLLVEQRRFAEAEEVMVQIQSRLSDPSPAMGRIAWIHRQKGDKAPARDELAAVVRSVPWYRWGWSVLMDWLEEDKAWIQTRDLLGPPLLELKTDVQFSRKRLLLLEKASLPVAELDSEWNSLLRDFPEDVSLYLNRYDSLRDSKRLADATAVLNVIRPVAQDSPYFLARFVEAIANDQLQKDQTIDNLLRLFLAPTEESAWPVDHAWKAIQRAQLGELAYQKSCDLLRQGLRPTPRALSVLAGYAAEHGRTKKQNRQPFWRIWFPDQGAREVLSLLKMVDSKAWAKDRYRGILFKQLCDTGYTGLVVKYWRKNKAVVDADGESWAQTGRALLNTKRKREARKLLADWRQRTGVGMWVVANYLLSLPSLRRTHLRETASTSKDALEGLPHDQCAKYLVHRQAEAYALLGDTKALSGIYRDYRSYFNGKLETGEWFETKRKYLLSDLPAMDRLLQENNLPKYRRLLWSLRWKRISSKVRFSVIGGVRIKLRWWWILFWIIYLLSHLGLNH